MSEPNPLCLLLIEDDLAHAELVHRAFASAPGRVEIDHVESLEEARVRLGATKPDLILSDLRLPDGSAIDLLTTVGGEPGCPLIVMTGQGDENLAVLSLKSGAMEYLVKSPETLRDLPRTVQRVLRQWELALERRAMQVALRVSEERLRLAMEAASDGLWDWDLAGRSVYWSPRMYTMLGYQPDEFPLTLLRIKELVHPDDRRRVARSRPWRTQTGGEGFALEFRMRTRSGGFKWIGARGKPVAWDSDGRVLRMVGTHVDIDDRLRYEQTLQETSGRLHALFDEANDAIVVAEHPSLRITEVNAAAEGMLGRGRSDLIGAHLSEFHPADAWDKCGRLFDQAGRLGAKILCESEVVAADQRRIAVEISASRISLPGGRLVLQGIYRDLTERRHLEAQLRQAQKMEAIGQLAGGVAHDFNNVLAAIMLQLGLLRADRRLPAEMQSTLTLLESATKRAADLTRQLLLFGRRQPAKFQPTDVDVLIANLLKMLRRLVGESVQIRFTPKADHHWVLADIGMVEQVVMNMVVNARDAMPQGGRVELSVDMIERVPQGDPGEGRPANPVPSDFVRMTIRDQGTGMDEATKRRLFEPFFTTKEVGKGSGLGLATAYSIVKLHNGWIEVESTLGMGSEFSVYLPFHNPVRAALQAGEAAQPAVGGNGTVLLVEDDTIVRTFAALSLRSVGYAVCEAVDGHDARKVWSREKGRIDVLLTDVVMPQGLTGWELASGLREQKRDLAVVLMSGYTTELPQHTLDPANRLVFLQKPFDTVKLTRAVRNAIDRISGKGADSGS